MNTAPYQLLYAVIGNLYGGSGPKTLALPDLSGRVPVGVGQGDGLTARALNDRFGTVAENLSIQQLPAHSHSVQAKSKAIPMNVSNSPQANIWVGSSLSAYTTNAPNAVMADSAVGSFGGAGAHNNIQPCVCVQYMICYDGFYPAPE